MSPPNACRPRPPLTSIRKRSRPQQRRVEKISTVGMIPSRPLTEEEIQLFTQVRQARKYRRRRRDTAGKATPSRGELPVFHANQQGNIGGRRENSGAAGREAQDLADIRSAVGS